MIESTNLDFHGQSCGETKVTIRTQTSDGKGACQLQGLKLTYIIERMRNSSGQKPYRSSDKFDTSRRNHASDLNCKVNYLNDSIDELHEKKNHDCSINKGRLECEIFVIIPASQLVTTESIPNIQPANDHKIG